MPTVDLNADLGEGFAWDDEFLKFVSSANVCLGYHAGSPDLTRRTLERCRENGVALGAHFGFPNREEMGRVVPEEIDEQILQSLSEQLDQSSSFDYLKPHGALYHWLNQKPEPRDLECWNLVWNWMAETELAILGLPGGMLQTQSKNLGSKFFSEGFCERGYEFDGQLIPRHLPGALLSDPVEIELQAVKLASQVHSICIHGDVAANVPIVKRVSAALQNSGFLIQPFFRPEAPVG